MDNLVFYIVVLVPTTFSVVASAVLFYHEPSHIVLKPNIKLTKTMDFGFAMGHQKLEQRLVVGAPHADQVGRVYGCRIDREPNNTICEQLDIDVKKLASDYDENDKDQSFCLGATIATTSTNFLTCAPLWTTGVNRYSETIFGSYGTCFIYHNKTSVLHVQGLAELKKNSLNEDAKHMALYGGIGWSSLADEKNDVLLIGKPFDLGDIQYITDLINGGRGSNATSLTFEDPKMFQGFRHIGYALAAGTFFYGHTSYAFSVQNEKTFQNRIMFVEVKMNALSLLTRKGTSPVSLTSKEIGDMFGTCLHSADISADNFTDLLVGAPTHSIPGGCETGALYIYLNTEGKGYYNILRAMESKRLRIESDKVRSRFGAAIATSDLDGDTVPEIFVGAPYEDFGIGAVYILSGYEILKLMTPETRPYSLQLKDLTGTQRIQKTDFRSLGFSLQIVSNINRNGCDGLAVGSPESSSVILLQCVPSIDAFLSIDVPSEVKSTDTSFPVNICVRIVYHTKSKTISTKLQVTSKVHGKGARLKKNKFAVDLADKKKLFCKNVTVTLRPDESDVYNIESKLEYLNEDLYKQKEFDTSWVRLSKIHSHFQDNKTLIRSCEGPDCIPKLEMEILWGGRNSVKEFYVEEKMNETVTFLIKNYGASAYNACVTIEVTGAEEHIKCPAIEDDDNVITCGFSSPVERNSTHAFNFVVDINNKVTNDNNDTVHVKAELYADCMQSEVIRSEMDIKFIFAMTKVYIADGSHNVTVTETQVKNGKNSSLVDKHEYKIVNNGSLQWENVSAIIHVPKKSFIREYTVYFNNEGSKCVENDTVEFVEFSCTGMKLYDNPILVYLRTTIPYMNITENLNIDSSIELRMASSKNTSNFIKKSQTTIINYVKDEMVIGNNKAVVLIIVLVSAIIILLAFAAILYKIGFFKRKELNRLDSFKASVKNKKNQGESDMPSTSGVGDLNADSKEDGMEDFDMEVLDDSPFEAVPLTVDDEAALIVEDKPPTKSRTKSSSSQLDKRENKRKASSASHTVVFDENSSKTQL